jgi:hypothetical protein
MLGPLVLGQDFAVRVIELRDVTLGFVPDQANDGVVIDLVGRPTCGTERAT